MEHKRLTYLLDRHHKGECSNDEFEELENWYETLNVDDTSFDEWVAVAGGEEALADALFSNFKSRIDTDSGSKTIPLFNWGMKIAAGITGLLFLLGMSYWIYQNSTENTKNRLTLAAPTEKNGNRYVILPDSSKVLLREGSEIDFNSSNDKTREVKLTGEAYFQVKENADKPFIIRTGKLTTTVLGTVFNIRAYPNQNKITVTVTKGKVRVEDDSKILGILTQDQEIIYDTKAKKAEEKMTGTADEITWISAGMEFESVSFGKIAEQLGRRYGVKIRFMDTSLAECPITATFRGTETFSEILDIITTTRRASYRIENSGKEIIIEGKGCQM